MKFSEKPSQELKKQVSDIEEDAGTKIAPKGWELIPNETLQSAHQVRYATYLDLLRKKGRRERIDLTLPENHLVRALNNLEQFIEDHRSGRQEILRGDRQLSIFEDLQQFLESGGTEGYIKLPTGVGKTVIFIKLIESLGLRTLVVVPSKILVNQTGQRIEEFTDLEFGKVYSEEKNYSRDVTVITYSSLVNKVKDGTIKPEWFPIVILDEAHRSLSKERMSIVEKFDGIKIGFTATPKFSNTKNLERLLKDEIHSMELHEAIQEGLLCETHTIHAFTDVDLSTVSITSTGEYEHKELERAINLLSRNKAAVELYLKAFSNDKAVCYCTSVAQAEKLNELFKQAGVPCAVVTGETDPDTRREIFDAFRTGGVHVLLNVKVLVEGFDEPSCNVAFNLHPTLSLIDAEQRGGRPLRLEKDNPDKIAYVVDFIDKGGAKPAVLFSEILGGAARVPEVSASGTAQKRVAEKEDALNILQIDGLRIVTDAQSILEVSNDRTRLREANEIPAQKEGWESAKSFALRFGLNELAARTTLKNLVRVMPKAEEYEEKQRDRITNRATVFYSPTIVAQYVKYQLQERLHKENEKKERELFAARSEVLKKERTREFFWSLVNTSGLVGVSESSARSLITSWIEEYVHAHPHSVKVIDVIGEQVRVYTEDVEVAIREKIRNEYEKYPFMNSLPQLERKFPSSYSSGHHATQEVIRSINELRKTHPSAFGGIRVFGSYIETYDTNVVMPLLANSSNNTIKAIGTEMSTEISYRLLREGFALEETYKTSMTGPVDDPEHVEQIRARYEELRTNAEQKFQVIHLGKKVKVYVPPSIQKEIASLVATFVEREAQQLQGEKGFWNRHKSETPKSPWAVLDQKENLKKPKKKY